MRDREGRVAERIELVGLEDPSGRRTRSQRPRRVEEARETTDSWHALGMQRVEHCVARRRIEVAVCQQTTGSRAGLMRRAHVKGSCDGLMRRAAPVLGERDGGKDAHRGANTRQTWLSV